MEVFEIGKSILKSSRWLTVLCVLSVIFFGTIFISNANANEKQLFDMEMGPMSIKDKATGEVVISIDSVVVKDVDLIAIDGNEIPETMDISVTGLKFNSKTPVGASLAGASIDQYYQQLSLIDDKLRSIGYEEGLDAIKMDFAMKAQIKPETGSLIFEKIAFGIANMGEVSLGLVISGIDPVSIAKIQDPMEAMGLLGMIKIESASVLYTDMSLFERLKDNVPEFKDGLKKNISIMEKQMKSEKDPLKKSFLKSLVEFSTHGKKFEWNFKPDKPVPIMQLMLSDQIGLQK